ncbi:XRE family transcriptional regulator [Actinoplanes sp. HUAS TT8]|uniref:XRE family transcriptional regulator n=1 Tax=Actinoplanes sp. HUAS TT8 TaxID=3447453 RepID=UPI003F520938
MPDADMLGDHAVQMRLAALLRSTANDLKRPDEYADTDLGLPPGTFARLINGTEPITWPVLVAAATAWPVNLRDLLPLQDDTDRDVRIFRAAESAASSRILDRAGRPYYEYRDTVMSRLGSFRPEWIRMLCTVADNEPGNPAVQWNRGHLLYQLTYVVGPVNYYYSWDGTRRCIPMRTGDSVFGLPYAPHSFTSRDADEPAYILALTYGGDLTGDPQRELAVLGEQAAHDLAYHPDGHLLAQQLTSLLHAKLLSPAELADRAGLDPRRVEALLFGKVSPPPTELAQLAAGLRVNVRELMPVTSATTQGISVQFAADARRWRTGGDDAAAYEVTELAGDPLHPHTTAVDVRPLLPEPNDAAWTRTYQHQYVYVLEADGTRMSWDSGGRHQVELQVGDSVYLKPQVPVAFTGNGRLLILRIGGAVRADVRFALGHMASGGQDRYVRDTQLWYSNEGK